jgi:hypothetical protein
LKTTFFKVEQNAIKTFKNEEKFAKNFSEKKGSQIFSAPLIKLRNVNSVSYGVSVKVDGSLAELVIYALLITVKKFRNLNLLLI